MLPSSRHNSAREVIALIMIRSDDVVFSVEYSDRTVRTAAYRFPGLKREAPAVHKGTFDPRVLFKAFMAMHDVQA